MTILENLNKAIGTNDTVEDMATEIMLCTIEDKYGITISGDVDHALINDYHEEKMWLESGGKMTNLEKLNKMFGRSDTAEDAALSMVIRDIEDIYGVTVGGVDEYVLISTYHAKKAWLESETDNE